MTADTEHHRPSWMPESQGELTLLGVLPNGNRLYSNYPGYVEEDGTIIINGVIRKWSWSRFWFVDVTIQLGQYLSEQAIKDQKPGRASTWMSFRPDVRPGGPLDFEYRDGGDNVVIPRYTQTYVGGSRR